MRNWIFGVLIALTSVGPVTADEAVATFAGGCFWCMEPPFDKLEGVKSTVSGYMGGHVKNPTYKQVSKGGTGHAEVIQIAYDPDVVSYETLISVFWRNVDPFDAGGQFCDRGDTYRSAIFFHSASQADAAAASKSQLEDSGRFDKPIVTQITPAGKFYPAEDYHQDYYQENAVRYKYYRWRCGRDGRLTEIWGDEADLR